MLNEKSSHVILTLPDGTVEPAFRYSLSGSVAEVISKLRIKRIGRINAEIAQRERYITWQKQRIAEWKPEPLKPIKERFGAI